LPKPPAALEISAWGSDARKKRLNPPTNG
jgi:hypothetical protein